MRSFLACAALFAVGSAQLDPLYTRIMQAANATLAQLPQTNVYPSNGVSGKYGWQTSTASGWTSGFFPGLLWQLFNISSQAGDASAGWWAQNAAARSSGLAGESTDGSTHDVGFIVYTSLGAQALLTNNQTAWDVVVETAKTLTGRYSPSVGCIQSWGTHPPPNGQYEVIIDNMLNLELLWSVANVTGNLSMWQIAESHSDHMITDIFQPFNGNQCVWHLVTYNYTTGAILNRSSTPQGLGLNTVWSRGQAWAINGFAIAHRFTRNPAYLATAQGAIDCFMRLLQECCMNDMYHNMPLWDFYVQAPQISVDTSAAMIAASGMVEVAQYSQEPARTQYLAAAKLLLDSALQYYSFAPAANDAVLANGTVTFPLAGIPIIYADYYLLQTKMRWDATPAEWRQQAEELLASGKFKWE